MGSGGTDVRFNEGNTMKFTRNDVLNTSMMAGILALVALDDQPQTKRRGWKKSGTSATGSISVDEREFRNKKRKIAKQSKKRNR